MAPLATRIGSATLFLFAATGCGDVFFAEVEAPELCVTYADQEVAAAPPLPVARAATIERTDRYALGDKLPTLGLEGAELEANLLSVTFTAKDLDDLGFIDQAVMKLEPPQGSALAPMEVVSYQRDPSATPFKSVSFRARSNDVVPYMNKDEFALSTTLGGTMPTRPWKVDIKVCVYAKTRVQYLQALQGQ